MNVLCIMYITSNNSAFEACEKINTKMEMLFVPYHFLQSVITKITGAVIVACSAYFYINGTMSAVYAIGMTISAFMLYSSLECAGNYSSLLHVVSVLSRFHQQTSRWIRHSDRRRWSHTFRW